MNTDQLHEFILDYLDGNLDPSKLEALTKELESLGYDLNNLEDLLALVNTMDEVKIPEPSQKMDDRFYSMLKEEINVSEQKDISQIIKNWLNAFFTQALSSKLSYGFIMLLIGLIVGFWIAPNANINNQMSQMNDEMQEMKNMVMLTLLNQPMASDRLKAVGMIKTSSIDESQIIESLLKALNTDKDANVRLVAAEALFTFASNQTVKEGLIYAVKDQPSPIIQMTLIDGLVAMNIQDAVPEFRELVNKEGLNGEVMNKLNDGIEKLI